MRVLVVSDIHSNWAALRAIAAAERGADAVVCLGDVVDYGPRPAEVVEWVREHAVTAVRGNHDAAVATGASCGSSPLFRRLSEESRRLTVPMLGPASIAFLRDLPDRSSLERDGARIALLHAAPADPLYEYLPATDVDGWRRSVEGIDCDVLLVGHTHVPALLDFGEKRVVNPGSVGLQRDGDPRAAYAVLDGRRVELKRLEYDVEETVAALRGWGLPRDVEHALEAIYRGTRPEDAIRTAGAGG